MSEDRDKLIQLGIEGLKAKGLFADPYKDRFKRELKEIDDQDEHTYFCDLVKRGVKYPVNQHNLLIVYVLGLTDQFDSDKPPTYIIGEFPDIDTDFLPEVKERIKEWAREEFGAENVCPIGNYSTFGIKSGLKDMARVFDLDHQEVNQVTRNLEDKDDDGKPMSWDKAIELFPEFKAYCEANTEVAEATKKLLHRNRGLGKHAGGLIISSKPITNLVPLIKNREENEVVSAFVEGLHGTDLGPLGLIKFDVLSIIDLQRIVECCRLIKQRNPEIKSICALPGQADWTDISYLNDPKSLAMANDADTIGIFQFGGWGIRKLLKDAGVNSFDDLVAIVSLFRPGPLGMKMDKTYVARKKGLEEYKLHPLIEKILGVTYGVMTYQESVMQILNKVGGIPLIHCEKVRKAMAKKKVKDFLPYKITFIGNGQKTLNWIEKEVENLWQQAESFSDYGFNKSHATAYSYISARLLKLKTHWPLEFFTITLRHAKQDKDEDQVKIFKQEAEAKGYKINRLDLNKSKFTFDIIDNEIYIGFVNIKGIGEAVAQRIVDGQPYASFEDFLHRFGTDAGVLKPLIGLGVFKGADRSTLIEFAEHYKKEKNKREARDSRNLESRKEIVEEFKSMLPTTIDAQLTLDGFLVNQDSFLAASAALGAQLDIDPKSVAKLAKKYIKNVTDIAKKQTGDCPIRLADFQPKGDIDAELKEMYENIPQVSEVKYYGFGWDHILKFSPDYRGGLTFRNFEDENKIVLLCEVQVAKPAERKKAKSGNYYYTMKVEDAEFQQNTVTIWQEDFDRFKDEFTFFDKKTGGNLLKIRLQRPSGGFSGYTFDSPPKATRHKYVPKDKSKDVRCFTMKHPYRKEPEQSEVVAENT